MKKTIDDGLICVAMTFSILETAASYMCKWRHELDSRLHGRALPVCLDQNCNLAQLTSLLR